MNRYLLKRKAQSADSGPDNINWEDEIQFDPGKRKGIGHYLPNKRDVVRRKYLQKGPC